MDVVEHMGPEWKPSKNRITQIDTCPVAAVIQVTGPGWTLPDTTEIKQHGLNMQLTGQISAALYLLLMNKYLHEKDIRILFVTEEKTVPKWTCPESTYTVPLYVSN